LAVTDWRLRRWRLWFLALMTATRSIFRFGHEGKTGKGRDLVIKKIDL